MVIIFFRVANYQATVPIHEINAKWPFQESLDKAAVAFRHKPMLFRLHAQTLDQFFASFSFTITYSQLNTNQKIIMNILDELKDLRERADRQDFESTQSKLEKAEQDTRRAEDYMARSIAEANGDDCAAALRMRDASLEQIRLLSLEHQALKEKQSKPSPLCALAGATKLLDLIPHIDSGPQTFADSISANDLLDRQGIASYLAYQWFSENSWFATASPIQRSIVETLHNTLRAQDLAADQPAYWSALTGLTGHLKLDSFVLPKEVREASFQEKILTIMETLVGALTSVPTPKSSEAPAGESAGPVAPARKKSARIRKKKSSTPSAA